jgi:hypothetical protein
MVQGIPFISITVAYSPALVTLTCLPHAQCQTLSTYSYYKVYWIHITDKNPTVTVQIPLHICIWIFAFILFCHLHSLNTFLNSSLVAFVQLIVFMHANSLLIPRHFSHKLSSIFSCMRESHQLLATWKSWRNISAAPYLPPSITDVISDTSHNSFTEGRRYSKVISINRSKGHPT